MNIYDGIRASYLAEGLNADQVQSIASIATEATFSDRQVIVQEFDREAESFYILLRGKVQVTTATGDLIARLAAGQVLGEIAIFGDDKRTASVVSDGESTLARINADAFNALLTDKPELGVVVLRNLGGTLCRRLRSSNVQLEAVLAGLEHG